MALRSTALLVLLLVLTIALPAATVVSWAHLGPRRWVRGSVRVTMLLACQLAAVLCAAVAINDYAYFFDSWGELFGSTPAAAAAAPHAADVRPVTHRVHVTLTVRHFGAPDKGHRIAPAAPTAAALRRKLPRSTAVRVTDWSVPSQWATHGAVATFSVPAPLSDLASTGDVYLPPTYFTAPARIARRLPVVEVFADTAEQAGDVVYQTPLPGYLLSTLRARQAAPMVLVMLRAGTGSGCVDPTAGGPRLDYYAHRLPDLLARTLHLVPSAYAAIGLGAGGYCALRLAITDPRRFHDAASLLGCWAPVAGPDLSRRPAVAAPARPGDDLTTLERQAPAPVSAFIAPGVVSGGVCGSRQASAWLKAVRAPTAADEVQGYRRVRFRWMAWRALLPRTFTWLSERFPT